VSFRIRELSTNESNMYCNTSNTYTFIENPSNIISSGFTKIFSYRVYSSGCYIFNEETFTWTSKDMEVISDSNSYYTHCRSKRTGTYAGGYLENNFVKPEFIMSKNARKSVEFWKSIIVCVICILLSIVSILLILWAIYTDTSDSKKMGMTYLVDNQPMDKYKYKITVFTGSKLNSDTESNVMIAIYGDLGEIKARSLQDLNRKLFSRGGIDCFILTTNRSIGSLDLIKMWHDNTGRGDKASWYLDYVIVQDLQTKEKYYFHCQKWFAVDKDDYEIERMIPDTGKNRHFSKLSLIKDETKKRLNDYHLILSIFNRPADSTYNRLDRTICFSLDIFLTIGSCLLCVKYDRSLNEELFITGKDVC
jgi:polycystin 1L2